MYRGGDTDTGHPEVIKLDFTSKNWEEYRAEIEEILQRYLLLKEIRDQERIKEQHKQIESLETGRTAVVENIQFIKIGYYDIP